MKLSRVSICFVLKIFIIISMTAEGSITDIINSYQIKDWELLKSLARKGITASDLMQRKILKTALPIIAKNYFTKQPILEAVVDSDVLESFDAQANHSYFFVKAVIGETYCPVTEHMDHDIDNNNEECFKKNMAGSLKLCAIHISYEPVADEFGDNVIKCWEMNNVDINSDFLIDPVVDAAQAEINKQVPHPDDLLFVIFEVERASYIFLNTSEIWYNRIFYLKFKVENCMQIDYDDDGDCFSPDERSKVLTCSGEIDLASESTDLYQKYIFHCE